MINEIYPHKFENQYQPERQISDNDFVLHYQSNKLLLKANGEELEIPRRGDFKQIGEHIFLFTLNDVSCFLSLEKPQGIHQNMEFKEINFFRTIKQQEIAWISIVGLHLYNWYSEHQFCGKCGTKMNHKSDERALVCPNCGMLFFPKISPAIIVAITKGDKILLARNSNFPAAWYALVAGYVDIGETLEETVCREVKEEVGLEVKNVRYIGSQPWPLTGSMMIGFAAEVADENQPITIDGKEIAEADWFTRGSLPNHPPGHLSISGLLIEKFENGEL